MNLFKAVSAPQYFQSLHDAPRLFLALLLLLKYMCMRRYKRTYRPQHSMQAAAWWRDRETATFSLHSNADTIVPDSLNRYDRKQLPHLLLCKRLGSPACIVSRASDVATPLKCWYYSTGLSKQVYSYSASRFTRGLVAQLMSVMVTSERSENVDTVLVQEVHTWWLAAPLNMTTMFFAHSPTILTNQMHTQNDTSENIFI